MAAEHILRLIHEGEQLKEEAIREVSSNADQLWKKNALRTVRRVAKRRLLFTTDSVWRAMEKRYPDSWTHEPRAMGAVMRRAYAEGWIERTDRQKKSTRPEAHRRPLQVWESLIIEED